MQLPVSLFLIFGASTLSAALASDMCPAAVTPR